MHLAKNANTNKPFCPSHPEAGSRMIDTEYRRCGYVGCKWTRKIKAGKKKD